MEENREFSSVERRLFAGACKNNVPINGSLELLPLCNMNCDMCYIRLSREEMQRQGRMLTGEEWLSIGRQLAETGTLFLLLTGGEPLLHPDFREIYLGLKQMGFILTINTNGTLIDEEWADFFEKNKPRRINITLYGADSNAYEELCHYRHGFERVLKAVSLLRQRDVDVKLGSSVTCSNYKHVSEMLRVANENDVPISMDTYMMPACRERGIPFEYQSRICPEDAASVRLMAFRSEMGEEVYAQYCGEKLKCIDAFQENNVEASESSCHAGRCSFTINWQGKLRPCVVCSEPSADVFEMGFDAAWKQVSREFQQIRFCAQCSNCRLRPVCRTCALACLLETGDYMKKPDYLCRYAAETERLLRLSLEEENHE